MKRTLRQFVASTPPFFFFRRLRPLAVMGSALFLLLALSTVAFAGKSTLGDHVWYDVNNDGVPDPGEGINGVQIVVYEDDGDGVFEPNQDTPITTTVTISEPLNADGDNTNPGDAGFYDVGVTDGKTYFVQLLTSNFAPGGALDGLHYTGDPSEIQPDGSVVQMHVIPLGQVANINTADFGFIKYSLGNQVFFDANNNGRKDAGEAGALAGVILELLNAAGQPITNTAGAPMTTTTTISGFYLFSDLAPGDYRVRVAALNFQPGGLLAGYVESSGPAQEANPNGDLDNNDNGIDNGNPVLNGATSGVVTLGGASYSNEPTGETPTASGIAGDDGDRTRDIHSNLTVDFGFYKLVLGSQVWLDDGTGGGTPDDGLQNGTEKGIPGVIVTLLDGNGNPVLNSAGQPMTTTTDSNGIYTFTGIVSGTYMVQISNYPGGHASSNDPINGSNPNASDGDDNGQGTSPGVITSAPFPLLPGGSYPGGGTNPTTGTTLNPAIDFGIIPCYSVGNLLWSDDGSGLGGTRDNGIRDGTEPSLGSGITVVLLLNGSPILTTTTDSNGYYRFDNLRPGTYQVQIPANQFAAGAPLFNYVSSSGQTTTFALADNNHDHGDDNELDGVTSVTIVLSGTLITGEKDAGATGAGDHGPLGDDHNNLTIDFGFVPLIPAIDLAKRVGVAPDGQPLVVLSGTTTVVTYTYIVTNVGEGVVSNLVITDDMGTSNPSDDTVLNSNTPGCAGLAGPLQQMASASCMMTVTINALLSVGNDVTNLATVSGGTPIGKPPTSIDDARVVIVNPSIAVSKKLDSVVEPARTGTPITFTILVTNTGNFTITKVPLSDTFNANYLQVDATNPAVPPADSFNNINGQIVWNDLGLLAPGASKTVFVHMIAAVDTFQTAVLDNGEGPCTGTKPEATCNVATIPGAEIDIDGPNGPIPPVPVPPKQGQDSVQILNPTAVNLVEMRLEQTGGTLLLAWASETEVTLVGFNLWVRESNGTLRRLNETLIEAQHAGQAQGAHYQLSVLASADPSAEYLLEIVLSDGRREQRSFSAGSTIKLFLPTVQKR